MLDCASSRSVFSFIMCAGSRQAARQQPPECRAEWTRTNKAMQECKTALHYASCIDSEILSASSDVVYVNRRLPRESRGQAHGRDHAARIGDALARDVERGAVIDRRPHDRQAERHIDRLAEREKLD